MSRTIVGQTKLTGPIAKAVGAQYAPTAANPSVALGQVAVPSPAPLRINGRQTGLIDVRTMAPIDIVNAINNANIPGVVASVDWQGRLTISGVDSIDGDGNLRAILGV
jgi:hypothetical protein